MAARGRPRSFDRDAALRRAMELFWTQGYEGTSVGDLTRTLGISSPSLYAAFGSKQQLFREAIALYGDHEGSATHRALREQPTARAAVEAMLRDNARAYAEPGTPTGCMVTLAAPVGSPASAAISDDLAERRRSTCGDLCGRLARSVEEGDLPPGTDVGRVAGFYYAVLGGLSLQARDGADAEALEGVVDVAMAAWDAVVAVRPTT